VTVCASGCLDVAILPWRWAWCLRPVRVLPRGRAGMAVLAGMMLKLMTEGDPARGRVFGADQPAWFARSWTRRRAWSAP